MAQVIRKPIFVQNFIGIPASLNYTITETQFILTTNTFQNYLINLSGECNELE